MGQLWDYGSGVNLRLMNVVQGYLGMHKGHIRVLFCKVSCRDLEAFCRTWTCVAQLWPVLPSTTRSHMTLALATLYRMKCGILADEGHAGHSVTPSTLKPLHIPPSPC